MTYDEHNDHNCTLRLRLWEADEPDMDQECVLQQRVPEAGLSAGDSSVLEALTSAKHPLRLLADSGSKERQQYRLLSLTARLPFSYFDVMSGEIYAGTAPTAPRA